MCAQSKFQLQILIKIMISVTQKFRGNILGSSGNIGEPPWSSQLYPTSYQIQACATKYAKSPCQHKPMGSIKRIELCD